MTSDGYQCQEMALLAKQLMSGDMNGAEIWLQNLNSCILKMKSISINVTNMVASLFLLPKHEEMTTLALQTLIDIAKQDICQVRQKIISMLDL